MDRLVETIAHAGVLPSAHIELADVAITSGEDKSQGFYFAARSLVPDLRHVSSIIISSALKKEWGCVPWKDRAQRGLRFPTLVGIRELFDKKHGVQEWPMPSGEASGWSVAS